MTNTTQNKAKIFSFLDIQKSGVLATVSPDSYPYVAAIYFSVSRELEVYFITKKGTKKSDNLEHNNRAMLMAFDDTTQTTAEVMGTVSRIENGDEAERLLRRMSGNAFIATGGGILPISKLSAGSYIAYKLTPVRATIATYSSATSGDYEKLFDVVDF